MDLAPVRRLPPAVRALLEACIGKKARCWRYFSRCDFDEAHLMRPYITESEVVIVEDGGYLPLPDVRAAVDSIMLAAR